jgi:small subunit ribosomal protein S1
MNATATTLISMEQLLQGSADLVVPKPGELIAGVVMSIDKGSVLVDLNGVLTGIIAGREMKDALDTVNELKIGDEVVSCVLESENEEGLVVLSLRRASQEKTWKRFLDAFEKGDVISVRPKEANKGGLLLDVDGIKGFIPVSQLAPLHYPRVNGADSAKILARLQTLIGQDFSVKIINIDKENGKLILSERAAFDEDRSVALKGLNVGDSVEGTISGVVKFGIFVAFDGLEGLVHISEIAWGHVSNAHDYGKRGDAVQVKVIGIEGDKISLSMKQLTKDPWEQIASKYTVGDSIKTKISRLTQFGAFVRLTDEINGLIHTSEIPGSPADPADALKVDQEVDARIIEIDAKERRVGLTLMPKGESPREKEMAAQATAKTESSEEA